MVSWLVRGIVTVGLILSVLAVPGLAPVTPNGEWWLGWAVVLWVASLMDSMTSRIWIGMPVAGFGLAISLVFATARPLTTLWVLSGCANVLILAVGLPLWLHRAHFRLGRGDWLMLTVGAAFLAGVPGYFPLWVLCSIGLSLGFVRIWRFVVWTAPQIRFPFLPVAWVSYLVVALGFHLGSAF